MSTLTMDSLPLTKEELGFSEDAEVPCGNPYHGTNIDHCHDEGPAVGYVKAQCYHCEIRTYPACDLFCEVVKTGAVNRCVACFGFLKDIKVVGII